MSNDTVEVGAAFANYVRSSGKQAALETIVQNLDKSVEESRNVMRELSTLYRSARTDSENRTESTNNKKEELKEARREISKFMASGTPKLLLPDMEDFYGKEVDVEKTTANLLAKLENTKKKTTIILSKLHKLSTLALSPRKKATLALSTGKMDSISTELMEYAETLRRFGGSLSHYIGTVECNKQFQKNPELESKLQNLCYDFELLAKMVQLKTKLESNINTQEINCENSALSYCLMSIKKLALTINEVMEIQST